MTEMHPQIYPMPGSAIAARVVGDELMVMNVSNSELFVLNPVATAIFEAANGMRSLEEIVTECVCGQFDVDSETARRDTLELVNSLAEHGVLRISDRPAPAAGDGTPA